MKSIKFGCDIVKKLLKCAKKRLEGGQLGAT